MVSCSIPECKFNTRLRKRRNGRTDIPADRLFVVQRPDLAKTAEVKEHRQNLHNILLSLRDASKGDKIKGMLHRERAGICHHHFLEEDMYYGPTQIKKLKLGAIPVLDMPKLTYSMKMRLKQSQKKAKLETPIQSIPKNKSIKTQTNKESSLFEITEDFAEESRNPDWITFPNGDISTIDSTENLSMVVCNLKDQMWSFILKLNRCCISLFDNLPEECAEKNWNDLEAIQLELAVIKELHLQEEKDVICMQNEMQCSFSESGLTPDPESKFDDREHVLHINNNAINFSESLESIELSENKENYFFDKNDYIFDKVVDIPEGKRKTPKLMRKTVCKNKKSPRLPAKGMKAKSKSSKEGLGSKRTLLSATKQPANKIKLKTTKKIKAVNFNKDSTSVNSKENCTIEVKKFKRTPLEVKYYYRNLAVDNDKWGLAYKCEGCGKIFEKWWHLKEHDKCHTKSNQAQCKECHQFFSTKYLRRHLITHKNIRNFNCDKCGVKYLTRCHLNTHQQRITACTFPSYECKMCRQRFHDEEECTKHLDEAHNTSFCDFCEAKVSAKCSLENHFFTLLKLYKCRFCEDSFTFKKEYHNHIVLKHAVQALQTSSWCKCSICCKYFTNQYSFRTHVNTIHASNEFLCDYCCSSFRFKPALIDHINNQHSNN